MFAGSHAAIEQVESVPTADALPLMADIKRWIFGVTLLLVALHIDGGAIAGRNGLLIFLRRTVNSISNS